MATVQELINNAADKYGIDRNLYTALINSEYDPKKWVNEIGARGYAQISPDTATYLKKQNPNLDLNDPAQNIDAGALVLRQKLDASNGDVYKAIQKYKGIKDPTTASNQAIMRTFDAWLGSAKRGAANINIEAVRPVTNEEIAQQAEDKRAGKSTNMSWGDFIARAKSPEFIFTLFITITLFIFGLYTLTIKATA